MSVDHLYFEWWTDEEGHPWVWHRCKSDGHEDSWRLPPPWALNDLGGLSPSLSCQRCGAHTILTAGDLRLAELSPSTDDQKGSATPQE